MRDKMEERINKIFDKVRQNGTVFERQLTELIGNREILIWGGIPRNDYWLAFAEEHHLSVAGYIDSDCKKKELNGYPIWLPDEAPVKKCYIIVGLEKNYIDVREKLQAWGKRQAFDYYYFSRNQLTITFCNGNYMDYFGNSIRGVVNGFRVSMCMDSSLVIGEGCKIDKSAEIDLMRGATLILEEGCYLGKDCIIKVMENGQIYLGKNCKVNKRAEIQCGKGGRIYIDKDCTFGPNLRITDCGSNKLLIHQDCMFSSDVVVQLSNGHALFNLESKKVYRSHGHLIEIGQHVWIGRRCSVRYGAMIGAGTMIGMESFVSEQVPQNVIAAGNPLKVIRQNIAWNRQEESEDWDSFEQYDFRSV